MSTTSSDIAYSTETHKSSHPITTRRSSWINDGGPISYTPEMKPGIAVPRSFRTPAILYQSNVAWSKEDAKLQRERDAREASIRGETAPGKYSVSSNGKIYYDSSAWLPVRERCPPCVEAEILCWQRVASTTISKSSARCLSCTFTKSRKCGTGVNKRSRPAIEDSQKRRISESMVIKESPVPRDTTQDIPLPAPKPNLEEDSSYSSPTNVVLPGEEKKAIAEHLGNIKTSLEALAFIQNECPSVFESDLCFEGNNGEICTYNEILGDLGTIFNDVLEKSRGMSTNYG